MDAATYVKTVMAAFAGRQMPDVMPVDAFRDMVGFLAQARMGQDGDWQQLVEDAMAEFTSLEAGEFENVRWFATGVLTGMLALRLYTGQRAS